MATKEKIIALIDCNKLEEATLLVNGLLKKSEHLEQAHFLMGKIHSKKGEWGEAINSYNKTLEINPDNQEAKSNIELAESILSFFNPDLFNP